MSMLRSHISLSIDGYIAGPDQDHDNRLGVGGLRLHRWTFATDSFHELHQTAGGRHTPDSEVLRQMFENVGAYIMGRNMFDPGRGAWDESWRGPWGESPPFHAPVFVLTHYPREPLKMDGSTTFTFVTDGIESALAQALSAADGRDVMVAGGAQAIQQYLAAGLLDELYLHIVQVVLSAGERLLENVGDPTFEPVEVHSSTAVTHVRYRVVH
jgi:dihydrofolate reductase